MNVDWIALQDRLTAAEAALKVAGVDIHTIALPQQRPSTSLRLIGKTLFCKDCMAFTLVVQNVGVCRRHPPVGDCVSPRCTEDDFCFDLIPKEGE